MVGDPDRQEQKPLSDRDKADEVSRFDVSNGPDIKVPPAVRRENAARDALRTYVRDLYFSQFGADVPKTGEWTLNFRAVVAPSENWALRFDPPLEFQVAEQLQEWQAARAIYREGRVYCFRCESSVCEHAEPPGALAVFCGYAPNGLPEWSEFAQVLVDARDPRVGGLFHESPDVVTIAQLGGELKKRQLASFGRSSRSYAVLGQVAAGYFSTDTGTPRTDKVAVTLQLVETRDEHGAFELRLNTLARMPDGGSVLDRLAEGWQPALARARDVALKQVADIQQSVRAARGNGDTEAAKQALRRVPAILHLLADSVARGYRQGLRRTHHAEERRRMRPVHKALDDAQEASPEHFLVDEKAGTFAVLGLQGRVHIFAPDGRHVTSLRLRPSEVNFRLRTQRWRIATPDEAARVRERIVSFVPKEE